MKFKTGNERVPAGYQSGGSGESSSIILRFSTKNLANGDRWQRTADVGTAVGSEDGQVGCSLMWSSSATSLLAVKKSLRCYLKAGTSWEYEGLPEVNFFKKIMLLTVKKLIKSNH